MPLGRQVGLSPGDTVRRGPSYPLPTLTKGAQQPPLFGPCLLWPRSPISATAELLLFLLSNSGSSTFNCMLPSECCVFPHTQRHPGDHRLHIATSVEELSSQQWDIKCIRSFRRKVGWQAQQQTWKHRGTKSLILGQYIQQHGC